MSEVQTYTAFKGHQILAQGPIQAVAITVKAEEANSPLVYDDLTGHLTDIDLRGTIQDVLSRLPTPINEETPEEPKGPGRPKLGVVAREITLLPRHWDWLATQPGGASITLRKLVEDARKANSEKDRKRQAKEAAYRFLSSMAGDLPNFEEVTRALFADNSEKFYSLMEEWPKDIRSYANQLAFGE